MMLSMAIQILLGVIYFGSSTAFNAFSGVGVICLTLSYAAPVASSMIERRGQMKAAKFPLGKFGWFCNSVVIAWSALAVPLFCMPSYLPVTTATVNYAPVVFVGFLAISLVWYLVWGRKHYRGPPTESIGVPALHDPALVADNSSTKKD